MKQVKKVLKPDLSRDFPRSASECGMEEAWGLGLLDDPQPPLKQKEDPTRFKYSRDDVCQSQQSGPKIK
jgi:hypothetical protein